MPAPTSRGTDAEKNHLRWKIQGTNWDCPFFKLNFSETKNQWQWNPLDTIFGSGLLSLGSLAVSVGLCSRHWRFWTNRFFPAPSISATTLPRAIFRFKWQMPKWPNICITNGKAVDKLRENKTGYNRYRMVWYMQFKQIYIYLGFQCWYYSQKTCQHFIDGEMEVTWSDYIL